MTSGAPNVQLIGFEKESELGDLLSQVGVFPDYKATLPGHLLGVLRKQYPGVIVEAIELLDVPKCMLGGMQHEQGKTLVRVQTLDVPLDLRVTLRVGATRLALKIQLVIKCEGLDSTPTVTTDMFVRGQEVIE